MLQIKIADSRVICTFRMMRFLKKKKQERYILDSCEVVGEMVVQLHGREYPRLVSNPGYPALSLEQ